MFCHRNSFKLVESFLLLSLVFTPALLPVETLTVSAQDEPHEKALEHQAIEIEKKPQRIFAPHWTTEEDFSTTIYIRNVHVTQALTARVSLVLDHRTVALPDIFVDSLQTVALDVKKALIETGQNPEQSGGAVIDFEAESAGAVNAYAQVLDTNRSLSFSFPFMQDGAPASGPLDAVAWYYNRNTNASIALQNTTDTKTTVTLTIFVSGRAISLGKRQLNPHETTKIKLPSPEGLGNAHGPRSAGVRVEYEGKPGAVIAQGWIADESIGFSAPFAFHPKSNCNCGDVTQHKYGAGIMIGKGGMTVPNAAPFTEMSFSPNLALRNRSDQPLTISPLFSYQADDKVERVTLPAINLISQENTLVNLREFQERGIIPSSVEMGSIDLRYTGEGGALLAELASVDQNGSFVSPVPLICSGGPASHMSFWRTDGDWHSSVTIENIASEANDVEVTISYPGGIYVLEQEIAAGKSAMISINELQQSQQPDREGRRIPATAILGGVNIWSPDARGRLVVNAMLMNPVTRTCGSCTEPGYAMSWAVSDKEANASTPLYYGFDPHAVNTGFSIWLNVRWSLGSQGGTDPSFSSSSNPSVATVSTTWATTLNPGTTNITATGYNFFTDVACSQPGNISSAASLTVAPTVTFQKSDGTALPNPLRMGISATTLGGVVHNRTQHLRAVITPAAQAANVTITSNNKLTVTQGSTSNGVISFDAVGRNQSGMHGDGTIKANYSGMVIATAAVDVLVPHNVSATHDTVGGGLFPANRALDATTSPPIIGVPVGQVELSTIYLRFLTITVCDQFGGLIGDLYQGAELSENDTFFGVISINQPLTVSSTYSDPVGTREVCCAVASGSAEAMAWPTQPQLPLTQNASVTQNISVYVDGFALSPAIANRVVTVHSSPVSVTVTWP